MTQEVQFGGQGNRDADRVVVFRESFLELFYDRRRAVLHAVWQGYQSVGSIQNGAERILDAMRVYDACDVLYDQTQVVGIWRFASMWLATNWLPRMQEAGLDRLAWVYSPARLSQVSADLTLSLIDFGSFDIQAFHDLAAAQAWLRPHVSDALSKAPRRLRAVVIEDNHGFTQLFHDLLQAMGCEAVMATTAQAGLALIQQDQPDVIFCDIGLPGPMDGFGLARALKGDERFQGIPLIAVSGYASDENRHRAIHAGFDRVCAKPVKFTEISELLQTLAQQTD